MTMVADMLQRISAAPNYTELAAALWDLYNIPHTLEESRIALSAARRTRKRLCDKNQANIDVQHERLATFSAFGVQPRSHQAGRRWSEAELETMKRMRDALFMSDLGIAK